MIPHYSPPFGLVRFVSAWLSPGRAPSVADLERLFEAEVGVPAVIVPAVRSGILMLLKEAGTDALAVGPSYTCLVVHEAMITSGVRTRFVEPAPDGLQVTAADMAAATEPGACLVLSELYGQAHDEGFLAAMQATKPRLRILDMAMGIPDPERLQRMLPGDVALFSFGVGKCLYAGGGGVAFFRDRALAARVREMRDAMVVEGSRSAELRNDLGDLASVAMRTRLLCHPAAVAADAWRASRERAERRASASAKTAAASHRPAPAVSYFSHEWTHAMTSVERRLAAYNLRHMRAGAAFRREQAAVYAGSLGDQAHLRGFDGRSSPQSHFPVLVPAASRTQVQRALGRRGIDTGVQFPFSGALKRDRYPGAARVSDEILTLPMGERVSLADVARICRSLIEALRDLEVTR